MRKKIMLDMDDVICQGGFEALINEFLNTDYRTDDFEDFYMQNRIPNDRKKEFFEFFQTKNFYDYASLLPDAYEVIKWLDERYDVYIGTSYIIPEIIDFSGNVVLFKFKYLREKLPFLDPYKFVFLADKRVLNCDYKVDDRLDNLLNAERKFLFDAFHNRKISDMDLREQGVIRVNGFKHLQQILSKENI